MKTTGLLRRIDDLGRIVIPKEIRNKFHLKNGELLEIYLKDDETIILKKHSLITNNQELLNNFVDKLANELNCKVYITNLEEIVFSSNNHLGEKLSDEIQLKLNNISMLSSLNQVKLTENIDLISDFKIFPLLPNGDFSGLLILDGKFDDDINIFNFVISFLNSYYENS